MFQDQEAINSLYTINKAHKGREIGKEMQRPFSAYSAQPGPGSYEFKMRVQEEISYY